MANLRALQRRRKAVRNIRKITRTMELVATARFKKAMDRASAASAYTERMARLVSDLAKAGLEVSHPLLEQRDVQNNAVLLVLTSNRGLCGAYNANVQRAAFQRHQQMKEEFSNLQLEVSGKRGISAAEYRKIPITTPYTHFEDKPTFAEVETLANRYLEDFILGKLDRLEVAYTRFVSFGKQEAVIETLLPLSSIGGEEVDEEEGAGVPYEFLPSIDSILEEVVPTSFKVKLFKCFLDSAVSEQISRMLAMKRATESADKMIKSLTMQYNRARQAHITSEIIEVVGGSEALAD
ncbi:ATP synthase gamma chain [Planctomycetales bacterium 10988]|nr:ATP synthase gamma chain [Planctomycetales bacterium 10988]